MDNTVSHQYCKYQHKLIRVIIKIYLDHTHTQMKICNNRITKYVKTDLLFVGDVSGGICLMCLGNDWNFAFIGEYTGFIFGCVVGVLNRGLTW